MTESKKQMTRRTCLRSLVGSGTGAIVTGSVLPVGRLFGQEGLSSPDSENAAQAPLDGSSVAATQLDLTVPQTTRWLLGVNIDTPVTITSGLATFPVFMDWPEQTVSITDRTVDGRIGNVAVRELDGARQVVVTIPRLTSGGSVEADCGSHRNERSDRSGAFASRDAIVHGEQPDDRFIASFHPGFVS